MRIKLSLGSQSAWSAIDWSDRCTIRGLAFLVRVLGAAAVGDLEGGAAAGEVRAVHGEEPRLGAARGVMRIKLSLGSQSAWSAIDWSDRCTIRGLAFLVRPFGKSQTRFRFFVSDGGLLSYGVDVVDMYRGTASYVEASSKAPRPATFRSSSRPNSSW
jgi:hypothetical protein